MTELVFVRFHGFRRHPVLITEHRIFHNGYKHPVEINGQILVLLSVETFAYECRPQVVQSNQTMILRWRGFPMKID